MGDAVPRLRGVRAAVGWQLAEPLTAPGLRCCVSDWCSGEERCRGSQRRLTSMSAFDENPFAVRGREGGDRGSKFKRKKSFE